VTDVHAVLKGADARGSFGTCRRRIQRLQERLGIRRKVDVVRAGMALLEQEADRQTRVARWRRAASLAAPTSKAVSITSSCRTLVETKAPAAVAVPSIALLSILFISSAAFAQSNPRYTDSPVYPHL
jgi:hypothetical protein